MTVKALKGILENYDDNDRVIIDDGNLFNATENNEITTTVKLTPGNTVVLQTRADYDVEMDLEPYFNRCFDNNEDEADSLSYLFDLGYNLNDFLYNPVRYEWAKRIAKEHGLLSGDD